MGMGIIPLNSTDLNQAICLYCLSVMAIIAMTALLTPRMNLAS